MGYDPRQRRADDCGIGELIDKSSLGTPQARKLIESAPIGLAHNQKLIDHATTYEGLECITYRTCPAFREFKCVAAHRCTGEDETMG